LGVTAIARRLGLSPSSCFNILKTLAGEELVTFDSESKHYGIGLGAVEIANRALAHDAVITAVRPAMRRLASQIDATLGLWRVTGDDRLALIDLAEGGSATRIHMAVGQRQPAACGATGRALMAGLDLDAARLAAAFERVRWQQAPTFPEYVAQVDEARRRGYAFDVDQMLKGITTIAAAIPNPGGAVRFCLSASVFSRRHDAAELRHIGELLSAAAGGINAKTRGL
jgi:DNA-binding IclR family transcriptional regulator